MTELRIPEPAGSLLVKTRRILDECITPHTPGGQGWRLGGGTSLAARWQHRRSTDLDIQIHPRTERHRLTRKANPALWKRMSEAGTTHIDTETNPRFEFGVEQRIELLEAEPIPRLGQEAVRTQAGVIRMLSPAQVLCGKLLQRAGPTPTRDLYDLAVAGRCDPEALSIAVNACPKARLEALRAEWAAQWAEHAEGALETLQGIPPEHTDISKDPARAAIAAVNAARYVHFHIDAGNGEVVSTAKTRERTREDRWTTVQQLREGAERSGANWAVAATGRNPGRIRNEAWNHVHGTERTRIVTIE